MVLSVIILSAVVLAAALSDKTKTPSIAEGFK